MILSDSDIKKALSSGFIKIVPALDFKTQLGSCSVDLRLGNAFRVFEYSKHSLIDPLSKSAKDTNFTREIKIKDNEQFIMQPGNFVLAITKEKITIDSRHLGRLEGRSSLGRLGIVVHSTASVFDPGWDGQAVLELGNLGRLPVALYPGMRICAMTFEQLSSEAEVPYGKKRSAKYKNQNNPDESRIRQEKK
jgi:dCTP deaminase